MGKDFLFEDDEEEEIWEHEARLAVKAAGALAKLPMCWR